MLASVLHGNASDALLDTYEQERKPIGAHAVNRSLENWINHRRPSEVLGLSKEQTPEENWERMRRLWNDYSAYEKIRLQFEETIATQQMEFYENNTEYGYTYESSAVVPDGTPAPQPIDEVHIYEPSTRPRSTLPMHRQNV